MSDKLPNLLVVGAKKAGSTLLHKMLEMHPRIFMSSEKEPHYLILNNFESINNLTGSGHTQARRSRTRARHTYLELFKDAPDDALYRGESSTGYTTHPSNGPVPRFIRMALGEPHMIYLLRDPVARMISNYQHSYLIGAYPSGTRFGDAIQWDGLLADTSRYAMQIDQYEKEFGPDCLHLMVSEQLMADPKTNMEAVAEFLGVSYIEAWSAIPDRVNSKQQLEQIVSVSGHFGSTATKLARRIVPKKWRGAVKSKVSKVMEPPEAAPDINEEERRSALDLITDDLHRLHGRLGGRIAVWPSIQSLAGTGS